MLRASGGCTPAWMAGATMRARRSLSELGQVVEQYLGQMGLKVAPKENHLYMFKYGSTAVVITLFEDEDAKHSFVRFSATTLSDFEPSMVFLQEILRLNSEVLFGSFLVFPDNTLSFSATLLGDKLDFEEFETALNYVAQVSDDTDDLLQEVAGGHRATDLMNEFDTEEIARLM
jgi:hypothetical protein